MALEAVPCTGLLFGYLPSWQDLHAIICAEDRTNQGGHLDPILVLIQVSREVLVGQAQLFSH